MVTFPQVRFPQIIHDSWHDSLAPLFVDSKMLMIRDQVLPACKYYPESQNIFRAFSVPMNEVRVVALGQDPYHNTGEATGLAFAVPRNKAIPPSLRVIQNEIINEGVERDTYINIDSDRWRELVHWRNQGIFLLNAALTVEAHAPGSHSNYWGWFTRQVVNIISTRTTNPVWMLWGAKAQGFKDCIVRKKSYIFGMEFNNDDNYVLEAPHPQAENYPNAVRKFTGCNHFKLCNQILKSKGLKIINW